MTAMLILMLTASLIPISDMISSDDVQNNHIVAQTLTNYRQHKETWNGKRVDPLMDIETAWGIEDTRVESQLPLVTRMVCNGAEMGYDKESRTFYCTLGMEENIFWKSLDIFAGGGY